MVVIDRCGGSAGGGLPVTGVLSDVLTLRRFCRPAGGGQHRQCQTHSVATDLETLRAALTPDNLPVCAALTPFEVIAANAADGLVRVEFEPQPAFGNHFGNIQGGFIVAMLDLPLSLAAFLKAGEFLPTVEIKTSFLAPARIGRCAAEGRVLRAGRALVFTEAKLWSADGALAAHATATAIRAGGTAAKPGPPP
jgi:uncharacterized protein (TIGR00369 family)